MTVQAADSELKARHRTMWASGNYPLMVDTFLLPLGPRLVDACRIEAGTRVLDVAAGTGNASIPAAQRGAKVTASDLTPELLEAGSARPEAAGLDLTWLPADAEDLPFESESFDVVMSSIGVMFAPHHQAAADELVRACRPGGTIGVLSWTPGGMLGALFATMKPFAPPPRQGRPRHLCGEVRSTCRGCSVAGSSSTPSRGTVSTSPHSSRPGTTGSTSRRTTDRLSRCGRTPSATESRLSSTQPSTRSATPGTAVRPVRHAFRRSICWR